MPAVGYDRKDEAMADYKTYVKALAALSAGKGSYQWDELEELITDDFEEGNLNEEQFDELMHCLMEIEPEE